MTLAIAPAVDTGPMSARRALVLALSGLTALTEVAFVSDLVPGLPIGGLTLSSALVPGLALAAVCGPRLLGRSTSRRAAVGFWISSLLLLAVLAVVYGRDGRLGLFSALTSAALGEELVYRLAIPAVIAAALRLGGVAGTTARMAGFTGAALWFCLLPGHREQITSPAGLLPFLAFAALSAFIVHRSGSLLPIAIGHAISNLLTVLMWREAVPADARSAGLACVLALLVLAYGRPRRITVDDAGGLVDTHTGLAVTAIDLRDGRPATVQLADGRILPVHAGMARPQGVPLLDIGRAEPAPSRADRLNEPAPRPAT